MSSIQESRQIEQESLTSKSRFLEKGTLWPNLCQVLTLDSIDRGGLGAGSSRAIMLSETPCVTLLTARENAVAREESNGLDSQLNSYFGSQSFA